VFVVVATPQEKPPPSRSSWAATHALSAAATTAVALWTGTRTVKFVSAHPGDETAGQL
jgi:hypothetical protein